MFLFCFAFSSNKAVLRTWHFMSDCTFALLPTRKTLQVCINNHLNNRHYSKATCFDIIICRFIYDALDIWLYMTLDDTLYVFIIFVCRTYAVVCTFANNVTKIGHNEWVGFWSKWYYHVLRCLSLEKIAPKLIILLHATSKL